MKTKCYYLRDKENRPIVTVCLLQNDEGIWSRGVAICSKSDNPDKKKGRRLAHLRAVKANVSKRSGLRVKDVHGAALMVKGFYFPLKSKYNVGV